MHLIILIGHSLLMYSINKGFSLWGENKHKADVEAARSVDKPDMKSAGFWNQSQVSTWYGDRCPWWSSGTEFLCALKSLKYERGREDPLVSGRVLLQHAIFGFGASMVSTLFSFKDSTIHNLYWNYAKCQPLVSEPWRKPLEMLGPRSSSGDCCARHHSGNCVDCCFVSLFCPWVQSETNKGLDFIHLLMNGIIYLGASRDFQITTPQHQWTIGWVLVELVQSPPGKCYHNMCNLRDHARYMKLRPKGSWGLGTWLWMFVLLAKPIAASV